MQLARAVVNPNQYNLEAIDLALIALESLWILSCDSGAPDPSDLPSIEAFYGPLTDSTNWRCVANFAARMSPSRLLSGCACCGIVDFERAVESVPVFGSLGLLELSFDAITEYRRCPQARTVTVLLRHSECSDEELDRGIIHSIHSTLHFTSDLFLTLGKVEVDNLFISPHGTALAKREMIKILQ